jgi:7-carboxy-7-deazaguanine synthase
VLTVNEIFYSIQGESTWAGRPCVFVRLAGCDLRCSWCDTTYAFYEGRKVTVDEVLDETRRFACPLVEITGGEPLLQEDVYDLMARLLGAGQAVVLETGGHRSIARVPAAVVKIVDIKCPGSGEASKNEWSNLDYLASHDEVKFVVKDRTDYEFARDAIRRHDLESRVAAVLISPVHELLEPGVLAGWMLEDRLPAARLQLQIHKYIWPGVIKGI